MILVVDNAVAGGHMAGEVARLLPTEDAELHGYPNAPTDPSLDGVDGVVLGGSGCGVYDEPDQPWIGRQQRFVETVMEEEIPLLGVCFGHQLVNAALGGTVVDSKVSRNRLVKASLAEVPLFEGVEPVVPVLHSDLVTDPGEGMDVVGTTDYNEYFATRHRERPVWTVQYHPEFTPTIRPEYDAVWEGGERTFAESTATRTLENFARFCREEKTA
ncbi:gamma-glutamyl-gamma-aminobutyrate hydrolase family protein [Halogeometricum sp. S1BR25-6]|uniref:Gamma-glutamyl-gamma-aminobutyrate hydrolase family protein n=1 Tax=Halogeometricum salsisoli TaxID=2950536 RepID=A0ABU2GGW7_9EURY|nr:gamma-glutamyl-gamma-aminobutyrate hydrolase family protein [Halogeometricum sp. S1BR25-6]MDS0300055.1 gamma-glutamyl-gamma-aminobutyrate hydrolase family protein [Halogeometricum sp. S1BR25-6]